MKFYVTEIAKGDDKIKGISVYEFETLEEAEASFHTKLGNAMKSTLYTEQTIYVTNSDAQIYPNLSKHFTR